MVFVLLLFFSTIKAFPPLAINVSRKPKGIAACSDISSKVMTTRRKKTAVKLVLEQDRDYFPSYEIFMT